MNLIIQGQLVKHVPIVGTLHNIYLGNGCQFAGSSSGAEGHPQVVQ